MKKSLVECKALPCSLPEALAREMDSLVAGLPAGCAYQRKTYTPDVVQFEPNERAEVSVITTGNVDKMNEVVVPSQLDMAPFRKSNVVLYNHDTHSIVGECQWVKYTPRDDSIRAKTLYFENTEGVESKWYRFVDETWFMVKSGALKAKSIGFLPLEPKRDPTDEELATNPAWKGAGIWPRTMLLEYSVCPVGINSESIVELVNKGFPLSEMGIDVPIVWEQKCAGETNCPDKPKPNPMARYKDDECVSKKIAILRDEGKDEQQAIAIAYAMCKGRKVKRKARRKHIDHTALLAGLLDGITFDAEAIANAAVEAYRARGRV